MVKRSPAYWSKRRTIQGGRALKKGAVAFAQPSVGNIARAAWSGVKYIRTLINVERKFIDHSFITNITNGSPQVNILTDVAQGSTNITRDGNSILLKTLQLDGIVVKHASATQTLFRWMIVEDTQQQSDTAPTYTDIFDSASSNTPRLNVANVGRYKILKKSSNILLTADRPIANIKYFRRFRNHHCRFNGTSASDFQKGHLYLILISSEATNVPSPAISSRCTFFDN